MARQVEHIEPLPEGASLPGLEAAPGLGLGDLFGKLGTNLPLVLKLLAALQTGQGDFSTNSPVGKLWGRIQTHPFPDKT